jgi:multidrug resistance efflux pump
VLVAPAPRPAGDRLGGADAAPAPVAAAAPFTVAGTTQISDGDAIELRSEEIQEIISQVPHWLVRCGTTVFFLTVAALLGLSWMVRYPDMVDGRLTLTTPRPPVRIVARTSGELQQVLVSDNARVARGTALAVLKNPADWHDVFRLSQRLDAMGAALAGSTPLPAERFDPSLSLGDIQPAYAELMRRLSDYSAFGQGSYYREKIEGTERQLADHRQLQDRLAAQQHILVEQMQLAGRKHERSQELARGSLISQNDLDQSATDYLQSRYAVRNGESALTNNNIQLSTDAQALLDLRQKLLDEDRQQRNELRSAYDALRSAIRKWEQDYVLRAPVEGRVSFFEAARVDQFVVAAQPVMAVVPQAQSLIGTALISEARAGKVRVGQRVIVKLDSYPAQEYGAVEGRVERISMLANEDGEGDKKEAKYLVRVVFPRGLVTSYGKRIPFRQEMRGVGSVVTEDRRLIQRIFDQLLYAATASRA